MYYQNIVIFDFETGSDDKETTEITQIGAMAVNPRTLEPYPGATFRSLLRPSDAYNEDIITPDALAITKQDRDVLARAPDPGEIWHQFAKWCSRWGMGGKNDFFCAPIPAGHNICNFDMRIFERYCYKYKTLRKSSRSDRMEPGIFNGYIRYDTMQELAMWFENLREPSSISLDNLRTFFGMPQSSKDNAHDALQDVKDTHLILKKIMESKRLISPYLKFKECFAQTPVSLDDKKKAVAKMMGKLMGDTNA